MVVSPEMRSRLEEIGARYEELEKVLADASALQDRDRYQRQVREYDELRPVASVYARYQQVLRELGEAQDMAKGEEDPGLVTLAREEETRLEKEASSLEDELARSIRKKAKGPERSTAIVEVRGGTGGEEASLFTASLFRMYCRYAERMGWKVEMISSHPSQLGGFKEVIFSLQGEGAYAKLWHEGGVHRVQRVPITESAGRIHTSTVTVAVLPEPEELEVKIDPADLRIDFFRASGPGGQHVNVTDSAVRITHVPTGIVAQCQDEKSQHKNRAKAIRVLRARLFEHLEARRRKEISQNRRAQVGSGTRSEKIRTYNFPQGRVTDHRLGMSLHRLEDFLNGNMDEMLEALASRDEGEGQ